MKIKISDGDDKMSEQKSHCRPIIRPRWLPLMDEYEYRVIDKKGKIVGVYDSYNDAEKKCEELEKNA